jgi:uncharacterized membrane protein YfcA
MTSLDVSMLAGLGLAAGVLTTMAGMGGGLFLVLALSVMHGPLAALAITSPALLLSNTHRAFLFRAHVARDVVARFAIGAIPAGVVGGLVAARLPPMAVQAAMLAPALLAGARSLGWVRFAPSARLFVPLSAMVGLLAAAAGGAGFLTGPLLIALGLSGSRYIGTVAVCAVVLHASRIVGYRVGGLLTSEHLTLSLVLFVGLAIGNLVGKRLRASLTPRLEKRIELGALFVCTALGLFGVGLR